MDLSTVITKIDKHNYLTAKDFLQDIDLICSNALEYNPDKDPGGKDTYGNIKGCLFEVDEWVNAFRNSEKVITYLCLTQEVL